MKQLMTLGQIAELLDKGYGELTADSYEELKSNGDNLVTSSFSLLFDEEKDFIAEDFLIRPWGSTDWIEPTVDIYDEFMKEQDK